MMKYDEKPWSEGLAVASKIKCVSRSNIWQEWQALRFANAA
jgi:hypothetical protein